MTDTTKRTTHPTSLASPAATAGTDATALPEQVCSIHIAVPVARVWEEITRTGRLQRAMHNTVLESELVPGSRLRYYSPDRKRVFVVGRIVAVDAPRTLSYTYHFTTWKPGPPTLVTWELREERGGCRVTVTHSGWTSAHEGREDHGKGWQQILGLMKAELETGRFPLGTRIVWTAMGWLAFMLPKTTLTSYADEQGW